MLVDFSLKFQVKTNILSYIFLYRLYIEHTWGLPSVQDQINWSNKDFEKVVNTVQSYNNCRLAWLEQREFFDIYLETVHDHPVYNFIEDELRRAFSDVTRPALENFQAVSPTETFELFQKSANPIRVTFDENLGSIANLSRSDTIYWTDKTSQLASFIYVTYNETDFTELSKTYGNPGYDKPNSTVNAEPESRVWLPQLQKLYQSRTNENIFLAMLTLPTDTTIRYGGFSEIWLLYTFLDETQFTLEWIGLNKTATRLAEASMLKFLLPTNPSCSLIQFDTSVDVQQATTRSSYFQRGADSFSCLSTLSENCYVTLNVKTYDAPIG